MAKKRYYDTYTQDSGMIKSDTSKIANMPQEVMFKEYPKTDYHTYDLDDSIKVIDNQMSADKKPIKKSKFPEKF